MKIYLVGGAVRDKLLNREVSERDYVVVGSTTEDMKSKGFKQVGRDFPVFLHPDTKEEYALARRERKVGPGYHGFEFDTESAVSLEEDLLRRDLTINAIAEDENGQRVDPYGGQQDLEKKVLRHISDAFAEDPVRILRVARFNARYHHLGFKLADETRALMYQMVKQGEINNLVPERVWAETSRALVEQTPSIFFQVLREVGALTILFPEIDALFGVPQTKTWHGEIDTGVHTLMVLDKASELSHDLRVCFAGLTHDLGKAKTPVTAWPSHHGHEIRGLKPLNNLVERMGVPNKCRDLAQLVTQYHTHVHRVKDLTCKRLVKFFDELDAYRQPERFQLFLMTCQADALGRLGGNGTYEQADYLNEAFNLVNDISFDDIDVEQGASGEVIKEALRRLRIITINQWLDKKHET